MPTRRLTALAFLAAACAAQERPAADADEGAMPTGLVFTLTTTRASWSPGDTAVAVLELVNHGAGQEVLGFGTGQRYDLALLTEEGDTLWRWSHERGFIQVLGEERLPPGGSLHWEEPVALPTAPGRYLLTAWLTTPGAPESEPLLLEVR